MNTLLHYTFMRYSQQKPIHFSRSRRLARLRRSQDICATFPPSRRPYHFKFWIHICTTSRDPSYTSCNLFHYNRTLNCYSCMIIRLKHTYYRCFIFASEGCQFLNGIKFPLQYSALHTSRVYTARFFWIHSLLRKRAATWTICLWLFIS